MIRINGLEERVSPIIGYHGTSDIYLREILKKGLLPSPGNRTWGEDPQASIVQVSRVSLQGSYWTTNLMTAISSSTNTTKKKGGDPIIVIASLIPESGVPDEDEMLYSMEMFIKGEAKKNGIMTDSPDSLGILFGGTDTEEILETVSESVAEILHKEWAMNPDKKPINYDLFYDMVKAFLERQAVFSLRNNDDFMLKSSWRDGFRRGYAVTAREDYTDDIPLPTELFGDKKTVEEELKRAQDNLTRYYKDLAASIRQRSKIRGGNFRILDPVTYSGRNRIIGVVREIESGYLELVYGEVPEDFIDSYEDRVGPIKGWEG